jgi:hypothetical protein
MSENSKDPWLDQLSFLRVDRQLFDAETQQLNRKTALFAPRSADYFDLCTTTISMLERMYRNLARIWAENHPLLRTNIRLLQMQKQFRAFHEYSLDTVKRLMFKPDMFSPSANGTDSTRRISLKSLQNLGETLKQDQQRIFHFQNLSVRIGDELESLHGSIQALEQALENDDSANLYLARLIETKRKRVEIMQKELDQCREWQSTKNYRDYTREFERRITRTLDAAILEIVKLRDQMDRTPTLFRGVSQTSQLNVVVPHWQQLQLPEQLISLYFQLYRNLSEATVRNKLLESFNEHATQSGRD